MAGCGHAQLILDLDQILPQGPEIVPGPGRDEDSVEEGGGEEEEGDPRTGMC